jgi:hypothetical protein
VSHDALLPFQLQSGASVLPISFAPVNGAVTGNTGWQLPSLVLYAGSCPRNLSVEPAALMQSTR